MRWHTRASTASHSRSRTTSTGECADIRDGDAQCETTAWCPSGLGRERNPIFDVNGVRIAVLSHTVNAYRVREVITAEGAIGS